MGSVRAKFPERVTLGCVLAVCACFAGTALPAQQEEELWVCGRPDGSVIYSDREVGEECRPVQDLPSLQRTPSDSHSAPADAEKENAPANQPEPAPTPVPGGGRKSDPPPDSVISISTLSAVPNFNGVLGIAQYQATLRVENRDSVWTAEKVCIDVHFTDRGGIFLDVHQVGCLADLRPFSPRVLTITYTGVIAPRVFPIEAEGQVDYVRWTKEGRQP